MGEWKTVTLCQLGRIITGKTPPTDNPANYGSGIPFITPSDMDGRKFIATTKRSITATGKDTVARSVVRSGAVLVSCIGSDMGKVAMASQESVTNQQINSIEPDARHCGEFIFYDLFARKNEIRNAASGSAQPILNKTAFGNLKINIPEDLSDQQAIAAILGSLDDKIDLNRRMNETLEAMARAIFKDWFVDFGPTRAKMEGRVPYLAQEIWDLFPDALDEEGKPAGWATHQLKEIAEHCKGSVTPNNHPEQTFEHYSLPAYDSGCAPAHDLGRTIKSNKTPIPEGAILLSKLNPDIPRVWIPEAQNAKQQISSTEFLVFRPKSPVGRSLLFCLFSDAFFRSTMQGMVTGTSKSHQRVSPSALLELQVLSGEGPILDAFEAIATPFLKQVIANRDASRTLAQTRDLLLPKLMSGEIRVKDAEKAVGAVL